MRLTTSVPAAILIVVLATPAMGQRVIVEMTKDSIADAIELGLKRRLPSGEIFVVRGWAMGRVYGLFSTPFIRVARAARSARIGFRPFSPADVTTEMTTPELHLYLFPYSPDEPADDVATVVMTPRRGNAEQKFAAAIRPSSLGQVPAHVRALRMEEFGAIGKMAVFPLDLLSKNFEIHVAYESGVERTCICDLKGAR